MRQNIYIVFFLILFSFGSVNGFSQIKNIDLSVVVYEPADSSFFPAEDTANISFYIKNNGPDTLMPNDTVMVGFSSFGLILPLFGVELNPNDTMQFVNAASFWNEDSTKIDTGQICISVHINSPGILDSNPLNDTSCVVYFIDKSTPLGILQPNNSSLSTMNVFPNPASNQVFVTLGNQMNEKGDIRIYDVLGNLWKDEKSVTLGNNKMKIDLSGIPKGFYFLSVSVKGKIYKKKLLVQ